MRLLEYQAKQCLAEAGVAVPQSNVVESATMAPTAPIVLKSQVPIGGRGKAGGVVIVREQSAVTPTIQRLFALDIGGYTPTKLLAEEVLSIARECYISLTINREHSSIELLAHTSGGIDVEEHESAAFFRQTITPQTVPTVAEALAEYLSLPEQAFALEDMVVNCLRCFIDNDCLLLEINPLVVTTDGQLVAGDAKMTIDDAALFRHPQWHEAALEDHNFVTLDHNGTVATIANGAGLAMATVDAVTARGVQPANFLDIGGTATPEKILASFEQIARFPAVALIIINIFGGIVRCDDVAAAIISAKQQLPDLPPLAVRLTGNREVEAKALLAREHIPLYNNLSHILEEAV